MSINAAVAMTPVAVPAPIQVTQTPTEPPASDSFDRRLDAAHRQQRDAQPSNGQDRVGSEPAPTARSGDNAAQATRAPAHDKEAAQDDGEDAGMLAAAMLALLGQRVAPPTVPAHAPVAVAVPGDGDAAAKAVVDGVAEALDASLPTPPPIGSDIGAPGGLMTAAVQPERLLLSPSESGNPQELAALSSAWLQPAAGTTAPPAAAHVLTVDSPAGAPGFAQELGQQVAWLGGQEIKQARIRLHPEELGQLDVKVSVAHDRVDVTFAVQHPAAVHAVQQTLPQLDSLLAQHGLALGHAEVGQQQAGGEHSRGQSAGGSVDGAENDGLAAIAASTPAVLGLLDMFA